MGLIRIQKNNGASGTVKGGIEYINGTNVVAAKMASAAVVELTVEAIDAAKDTVSITYSGGAGNPPSEANILAAWEPVLVDSNGSVCTLISAPQLYNDEATPMAIYPAVAIA
tara:strand:+ start:286 stop:621 length:336 start_codon:yes stop_codon:yes gene_type:complete